jgi:DNA-binding LytR/AlgR family response regulator
MKNMVSGGVTMIKIAICEDDREIAGLLDQALFEYSGVNLLKIEIDVFFSAKELQEHLIKGSKYDMAFIDVALEHNQGVELARIIREDWCDHAVIINLIIERSLISNSVFMVEPQQLLLRPLTSSDVVASFKKMLEIYDRSRHSCYTYKYGRDIYRISFDEILYFQVKDRIVHIKTTNEKQSDFFPGSLSMVEQEIMENNSNFFKANKNHLVNHKFVTRISRREIALTNGEVIALGENMYKHLIDRTKLLRSVKGKRKTWS